MSEVQKRLQTACKFSTKEITFVTGLYGILLSYLGLKKLIKFKGKPDGNGVNCIDGRLADLLKRVPGGVGALNFGVVPLLLHILSGNQFFAFLFRWQFLMSLYDFTLFIRAVATFPANRTDEFAAHAGGCARLSGNDPLGLLLFTVQTLVPDQTVKNTVPMIRDRMSYPYVLAGWLISHPICWLANVFLGKTRGSAIKPVLSLEPVKQIH